MLLRRDGVAITAPQTLFDYVSILFELGNDSDDRSFGYSHGEGDVTHAHLGVASEADDHVAVVAQECPARDAPFLASPTGRGIGCRRGALFGSGSGHVVRIQQR